MNAWSTDKKFEWIRVFLLTAAFFCVVAAYTVLREMRDVLFVSIVGCEYVQYVQILSMLLLIPALLVYAFLVDYFKKHQLLYIYSLLYAVGCLVILLCVGHPVMGLGNSQKSIMRLFGWWQYLFIEGYAPFVIGLFLAFVNSITPPQDTAKSYSTIIAGSKLGGMVVALFAWWFLKSSVSAGTYPVCMLFLLAAFMLLLVPVLIKILMSIVPESYMHGYEASYKLEEADQKAKMPWYESIVSGLTLMMRVPYAFGICALVFFWEVVSVVLNYNRLSLCVSWSQSVTGLSSMLFLQMFWIHVAGFFIALIGTRSLLSYCGERWSLVLVPVFTSILIVGYFVSSVPEVMVVCYVLVRAINYSLAISVREVLYIPTTKEVRFKTKSWVDAFGAKFARGTGSCYSLVMDLAHKPNENCLVFCLSILCVWMITAYQLGRRFEKVIKDNEVIG